MNTKHDNDKPFEIVFVPVKIEPIDETGASERDENCCSLPDFPLKTESKDEENIATPTRKNDEVSTSAKNQPLEQCGALDEVEHSYHLISSSLKTEIDERPERLEDVESGSRNYESSQQKEYMELNSACSTLETTTESKAEYEIGIEVKYLDVDPRLNERHERSHSLSPSLPESKIVMAITK